MQKKIIELLLDKQHIIFSDEELSKNYSSFFKKWDAISEQNQLKVNTLKKKIADRQGIHKTTLKEKLNEKMDRSSPLTSHLLNKLCSINEYAENEIKLQKINKELEDKLTEIKSTDTILALKFAVGLAEKYDLHNDIIAIIHFYRQNTDDIQALYELLAKLKKILTSVKYAATALGQAQSSIIINNYLTRGLTSRSAFSAQQLAENALYDVIYYLKNINSLNKNNYAWLAEKTAAILQAQNSSVNDITLAYLQDKELKNLNYAELIARQNNLLFILDNIAREIEATIEANKEQIAICNAKFDLMNKDMTNIIKTVLNNIKNDHAQTGKFKFTEEEAAKFYYLSGLLGNKYPRQNIIFFRAF